ncbi:MAG TPA: phage tail sheath C-terminal domain-containing protein [Acidimicrobiales bacterium]|jgi:phage tail sheath protein FI|nr:phage tail sheath C-terminal domain-containing protein [Acidimicrobiales bacterium]
MPAQLTYPGVYIEEVPSGVRTIVGVATSITAFVGRTRWGPVADATDILSASQFARVFGGRWPASPLTQAVDDFFQNGGSHAVVVRLVHDDAETAALSVGGLDLVAASPGSWGADLRAAVDHADVDPALAASLGLASKDELFNLTVTHAVPGGAVERYANLSVKDNRRNVAATLKEKSDLVRVAEGWGGANPPDPTDGKDALGTVEDQLGEAKKAYRNGTGNKAAVTAKETELRTAVDTARAAAKDGSPLALADFTDDTAAVEHKGLFALDGADTVNLLCIPPHEADGDIELGLVAAASTYCEKRRALFLVDPRTSWTDPSDGMAWIDEVDGAKANAAVYFPRLKRPDGESVPCGAVAGVMARTDAARGVWKAPAGLDAVLRNVPDLAVRLNDDENGLLNPVGVNCLRSMPPAGRVVWGARTAVGADVLASDWKYVPVRRLALFLEESLFRGTKWVVFEPNDEPLWSQIRLSAGSFMHQLFRQGAFQGRSPREAYFVKCDGETTTQADRDLGVVNVNVGFAPLKPAEFVVIRLQQMAGQVET